MNERARRRTTETAAPTSWFERTPVRSGSRDVCGPVRSRDGEPARGWRSRWTGLIRTGGISVCGWCLGCVCVLDAVRIGTSLILHLNALLGHPSLIAPQWCPNHFFERVLCTDSFEPIRSADLFHRLWWRVLTVIVNKMFFIFFLNVFTFKILYITLHLYQIKCFI